MRSERLRQIQCFTSSKGQSRETNPGLPFHYAVLLHNIGNWLLTQSFVIKLILAMIVQ